jgi:hypothetical protein
MTFFFNMVDVAGIAAFNLCHMLRDIYRMKANDDFFFGEKEEIKKLNITAFLFIALVVSFSTEPPQL